MINNEDSTYIKLENKDNLKDFGLFFQRLG